MMDSQKDSFLKLINFKLKEKGLDNDPLYVDRLKGELLDIEIAGEYAYFLDLYNKGTKYPINENNLLVVYLLDIAPSVDIKQEKAFTYGEMPDLDIDFIRIVRDYLKYDWAIKEFGKDYVCSIGSYTTFGIRSSLLDMARIFDYPLDEIRNVTTSLEDKDDEGKGLTWESALRLYPDLKAWCDKYPDAAEAANKISKRIRGVSRHAAGIVISKVPLNDIVPIIKTKEGEIISAWAEGLSTQDLQPIGLIKSDWLVIKNLDQIELACKYIRDRHSVESICAFPGDRDWSDDSYLDDPLPLATASKGDLKCIFQFDNAGLQNLVKEGGITEFTDIGIYSSLWRPGCMQSGMHKTYVKRKKGVEKFSTHPLLESILGPTFGVLVFQEQINKILNLIGKIPLKDCEILRKAISKKRLDYFQKYKEMFVVNAQEVLKSSKTEAEEMWSNIEFFSEYGFNKSHACGYAVVSSRLLWLKTYYPIEFYNAILYFEEKAEKIKEYKIDIKNHNIKLNPLDINLSKANFSIHNEELYYGFNKVKGIGHDTALKIEQGQPYSGFEDFIDKYGTDISTLKPLICLRCFKEATPMKIYKYLEYYRDIKKKVVDAQKNYEIKMANLSELIHKLLPNESEEDRAYTEVNFEIWKNKYSKTEIQVGKIITDPNTNEDVEVFKKANLFKSLESLYKRYLKAKQVLEDSKKELPKLADFDENSYKIEIKPEFETLLTNIVEAEKAFYGFVWFNGIEKSPDCNPHLSFSQFDEVDGIFPVEFEILDLQEKKGKKVIYYQVLAEDVHGRVEKINFWKDDYDRFENELKVGELIRARLKPPNGGFKTFQFESYRKFDFKNKVPERKEDDFRLVVMKKGTI